MTRTLLQQAFDALHPQANRAFVEATKDALRSALAAPQPEPVAPPGWRDALQFYADGKHFNIDGDPSAWDTVSGEPTNFWCDEAGTATVEDGTVAKMALAGTPLPNEDDDGAAPPAVPAPAVPDEVLDSLGMHDAAVKLARRMGYTWEGGEWSAAPAVREPKPAELLGMAVVDAIVDDGMRNAAGGIYATRVQEFAREVQIAFAQQNRVDLSGIGGGGNG